MLPGGVLPGECASKFESMKTKESDVVPQVSGVVAPGVLLTLVMLRLNRVPEPDNGSRS